jgi:hypothetical protein
VSPRLFTLQNSITVEHVARSPSRIFLDPLSGLSLHCTFLHILHIYFAHNEYTLLTAISTGGMDMRTTQLVSKEKKEILHYPLLVHPNSTRVCSNQQLIIYVMVLDQRNQVGLHKLPYYHSINWLMSRIGHMIYNWSISKDIVTLTKKSLIGNVDGANTLWRMSVVQYKRYPTSTFPSQEASRKIHGVDETVENE